MPELPDSEADKEKLKQIQDSVRAAASELLARGISPTISRISRVVEGDRLTLLAALEGWAANLSGADRLAMAGNKRRSNDPMVREATRTTAEAARLQRGAAQFEAHAKSGEPPTGSVAELQSELSRQEAAIERLRQRRIEIEATLESTNTQIRAAELRARLIAESLRNGGRLMNQVSMQEARRKASDDES